MRTKWITPEQYEALWMSIPSNTGPLRPPGPSFEALAHEFGLRAGDYVHIGTIWDQKREQRNADAALPIVEKLKILEQLRGQSQLIKGTRRSGESVTIANRNSTSKT